MLHNKTLKLFHLAFLSVLLSASGLQAQVPSLVNYQGRLLDALGNPRSTNAAVSVQIYNAGTGGILKYTESIGSLPVNNGLFSFQFGGGAGFAEALNNPEAWLQILVDGDTVGTRQRLVAVPYAIQAGSVLGGVDDGDADATNELNTSVAFAGNSLQVTDAGGTKSTSLAALLDNTDSQTLTFSNPGLSIAGGNSVDLSALNVDDADANSTNELNTSVAFTGNSIQVTDAGGTKSASLAALLDNTDSQTLSFSSPNLSISGGNSVDLSSLSGGGGGGGNGGLAVIKPSDQTNGTTTLTNDTHFVFALVPGTYAINGQMKLFGNSNDSKFALAFSGAASLSYFVDSKGPFQSIGTVTSEISVGSTEPPRQLHGVVVVTSAGNLTVRYARFENNDGSGMTMRAGSFIYLTKLN